MFTGIITDIGIVRSVVKNGDTRMMIQTIFDVESIAIGASIACAGACMTVVEKGLDWFAVDVSDASLACTTLGSWKEGDKVNLERSLKVGDELGGHWVTGHVDGVATVGSIKAIGDSHELVFSAPPELLPFIAQKGSVTVEGVSLTVNAVEADEFQVNLIPHTWEHTTLGTLQTGDQVNVEIDVMARYIARQLETKNL